MADPFVWQVHLRQDVLDDAMAELRALPHEVLERIVEHPLKKKVVGRDQKLYNLRVTADWAGAKSEELEIMVRLKRGWLGKATTDSFRVTVPHSDVAPTTAASEAEPDSPR